MKSLNFSTFLVVFSACICLAQSSIPSCGKIIRYENFASKYIDVRNIDVWLPDEYSTLKNYSVLYFQDGQMLFDSTITWNKQEWKVDEITTSLIEKNIIKDCIVVGIWNNGEYRHSEYFPQKILKEVPENYQKLIIHNQLKDKPQADNYLKFIVEELKPFIDSTFTTLTNSENTFIIGSSMGGLISLYALCEYPEIFGGAASLSIQWTLADPRVNDEQTVDIFAAKFREYVSDHLSLLYNKKIYFDIGTTGLDSFYVSHQNLSDEMMIAEGYNEENWLSKIFEGEDHTERAWSKRLAIPLTFLLKRTPD